jgi:hypothetical protein
MSRLDEYMEKRRLIKARSTWLRIRHEAGDITMGRARIEMRKVNSAFRLLEVDYADVIEAMRGQRRCDL